MVVGVNETEPVSVPALTVGIHSRSEIIIKTNGMR